MKQCPRCTRRYYDDTLNFCLEDGTSLVYGVSADEVETAVLPGDETASRWASQPSSTITEQTADTVTRVHPSQSNQTPPASAGLQELLDRTRKELLDLSTRNRLLSIPVNSKAARIIVMHDELSDEVFRLLVTEKKSLSFAPGLETKQSEPPISELFKDDETGLSQPGEDEMLASGVGRRHRLQTTLSPEKLQRRLLDLYTNARTTIEEQGVNVLYLALGVLKWFEPEHADKPRYAPLILIPVELERKTASERFRLRWHEGDIEPNLSLQRRLKEFRIVLPGFLSHEELDPLDYFNKVAGAIKGLKSWEVLPNAITLGFFSFAKLLMYRDLDSRSWPKTFPLLEHSMLTSLLSRGFEKAEHAIPESANLDELIPVSRLDHVVDADSSQTIAIERVRAGESMVIQGPPGTGKSQSISNIIANAALDGKSVLFVAEKLAALQVVKRRLENEGLGAVCLELHSHKATKRAVIEELGRTWKLGRPKPHGLEELLPKLDAERGILNEHAASLHEPRDPSSFTPFTIIGRLALLRDRGLQGDGLRFQEAETWTREDFTERRRLVQELALRVEEIGPPSRHNWRGVCRETVLNIDLNPLQGRIQSLKDTLEELFGSSATLALALCQSPPDTLSELERQLIAAEYVANAPPLDKQALCNGVWNAGLNSVEELLDEGRKYADALAHSGQQVHESIWSEDFSTIHSQIRLRGESFLRFLYSDYRQAVREFRLALLTDLPTSYADRISLCESIISGQSALRRIRDGESLGRAAFGSLWRNEKSSWDQLKAVLDWVIRQRSQGLDSKFREMFSVVQDQSNVSALREAALPKAERTRHELTRVSHELNLDWTAAFGASDSDTSSLKGIARRCAQWLSDMEGLSRWNNYFVRSRRARELKLSPLVDKVENGTILPNAVSDCFDRIYYVQLFREVTRQRPQLAHFDGMVHSNHVDQFRKLDEDRKALAKYRTLVSHYERLPPHDSGVGAAGIVKSEMKRKRGHRPVRQLLKDAGTVVQAIKPVFMMSPLSVAQFLEPGAIEFDLLVIDEASQVLPVDALGAIARCKQIVVVGDDKQLPPTRFFNRLTSNVDEYDEYSDSVQPQAAQAQDIESVLGLCSARGLSSSMLRWHYRSRHQSLIAVSNHEFYEDQLYIVPSPESASENLGLKLNHIRDGIYDRGGTRTNKVEAKAVSQAILKHARTDPQRSLGVATFSMQQRQAIEDELESLRRENPDVESFFSAHPAEPFFIKNLENVQGDERDVIFISVGYGRDPSGNLPMVFGPLSLEGGERRLNVLISRSKFRCEIFSSITADDINLERARSRGAAAFKTFLSFAETGRLPISQQSSDEEDSPFEDAVAGAIESLGYPVRRRVGIAGFFVDLGVVDPEQPDRCVLGIECDGAAYHRARSARDRDRLRQSVLEAHGWIIHHIWSTDWFQRPDEQLRKVADAIERAKTMVGNVPSTSLTSTPSKSAAESENQVELERVAEVENRGLHDLAEPYSEANFRVPNKLDPHELHTTDLAAIVLRIVEHEGPIHEEQIIIRLRTLWGKGRAGSRIQDAIARAIRYLIRTNSCVSTEHCLTIPGCEIRVRNRANGVSLTTKRPEHLPPIEIRASILAVLDANHGAKKNEVATAVARVMGFHATSAQLKAIIESQFTKLLRTGKIEELNGMFKAVSVPASTDSR
jgi:very-short-patch-repair endonuclease